MATFNLEKKQIAYARKIADTLRSERRFCRKGGIEMLDALERRILKNLQWKYINTKARSERMKYRYAMSRWKALCARQDISGSLREDIEACNIILPWVRHAKFIARTRVDLLCFAKAAKVQPMKDINSATSTMQWYLAAIVGLENGLKNVIKLCEEDISRIHAEQENCLS